MEVHESTVIINPLASARGSKDAPVEWYDFGAGTIVSPGVSKNIYENGYMIALTCVRKEKFYFKAFELKELPTEEEVARLFKEYAPAFAEEVEKKAQETQNNE